MIHSLIGQRLLGLGLIALSIPFVIYGWSTLISEGYYYPKAAALFPVGVVAGLGMVLSPIDYDRLWEEHHVEKITVYRHLPFAWKMWSLAALAAGLRNWAAMANY